MTKTDYPGSPCWHCGSNAHDTAGHKHPPRAANLPRVDITDLVHESHDRAKRKGFYDDPPSVDRLLCLIHGEVTEAHEETRSGRMTTELVNGKPEGLPSELADVVIRVCDMAGFLGIDLATEIERKAAYNESRPRKHGRKF